MKSNGPVLDFTGNSIANFGLASFNMSIVGYPSLTYTVTMSPAGALIISPNFICDASLINDVFNVTGLNSITVSWDSVIESNVLRYDVVLWDVFGSTPEQTINITPTGAGDSYSTPITGTIYPFGSGFYDVYIKAIYINGTDEQLAIASGI